MTFENDVNAERSVQKRLAVCPIVPLTDMIYVRNASLLIFALQASTD